MSDYILFRNCMGFEEEEQIAKSIGKDNLINYRSQTPFNSTVIGRYSVLPYYQELEQELLLKNSKLINSYEQHKFIADMKGYDLLQDLTPTSYFNCGYENVPYCEHGYVVKGLTNSRKFQGNTHMYARDKDELKDVMLKLYDDPLISEQGLVIREYVPLVTLDTSINGMRFTKEHRFFCCGEIILTHGFYWSCMEGGEKYSEIEQEGIKLVSNVAKRISKYVDFFVVDVAHTLQGDWIVIELNDGQMAGLSSIDPQEFYHRLKLYFAGAELLRGCKI